MEPDEMNVDEMEVEQDVEMEEGEEDVAAEVNAAVAECFEEGGAAYGADRNDAINAVINKLEGMKEGDSLGGLGADNDTFELPDEEDETELA